jgi:hypothetical protein
MSPHGPGQPAPSPEGPTEELPLVDDHLSQRQGGASPPSGPVRPSRIRERAIARQAEYRPLANAVREHRRAATSPSVAITAADRRLYEVLERLEQPN